LRFAVNRRTIEQDDELIPLGEFNTLQEALDWTHTSPSI